MVPFQIKHLNQNIPTMDSCQVNKDLTIQTLLVQCFPCSCFGALHLCNWFKLQCWTMHIKGHEPIHITILVTFTSNGYSSCGNVSVLLTRKGIIIIRNTYLWKGKFYHNLVYLMIKDYPFIIILYMKAILKIALQHQPRLALVVFTNVWEVRVVGSLRMGASGLDELIMEKLVWKHAHKHPLKLNSMSSISWLVGGWGVWRFPRVTTVLKTFKFSNFFTPQNLQDFAM